MSFQPDAWASDYLRRERNDLHEALVAQLARHRTKHARTHRLAYFVDQNGGVRIEPDVRSVLAAGLLAHADDYAPHHFTLLDGRFGRGFTNAGRNNVTQAGAQSQISAARQNTLQLAGAAVIGHLQDGAHPNHDFLPPFFLGDFEPEVGCVVSRSTADGSTATCTAFRSTSPSRQRFSLLIGRHSMIRTVSPICALCSSSWA